MRRFLVKEFGRYGNSGKLLEFSTELDRDAQVRLGNVDKIIDLIEGDLPSTLPIAADLSGDNDIRLKSGYFRYNRCEYRTLFAVANSAEEAAYGLSEYPVTVLVRERYPSDASTAIVFKRRKA